MPAQGVAAEASEDDQDTTQTMALTAAASTVAPGQRLAAAPAQESLVQDSVGQEPVAQEPRGSKPREAAIPRQGASSPARAFREPSMGATAAPEPALVASPQLEQIPATAAVSAEIPQRQSEGPAPI